MTDGDNSKAKRRGRGGSLRRSEPTTADTSGPTPGLASEGAGRPTCPAPSKKGAGRAKISIELSKAQIDQVVRDAGRGGTMSVLLSAISAPDWALAFDPEHWPPPQMEDRRLSRSLLLGLFVLSCFTVAGKDLGIADVAKMLRMETSTTHRYITTLLAVGLLKQDPSTRRYRLASA
jgi:hypothetical protein